MPLVLVLLFGYAVSFDVDEVPIAVVDQDRTADSRQFLFGLDRANRSASVAELEDPAEIEPLFLRGTVKAAIIVPAGFARTWRAASDAPVQSGDRRRRRQHRARRQRLRGRGRTSEDARAARRVGCA